MRPPLSRLALRIYLFGLAQFLLVMAGMFAVLATCQRPPLPFTDTLRFVVRTLADTGGDAAAVSKVVAGLSEGLHCAIAVYDGDGRLVAHDARLPAPALRATARPAAPDLTAEIPMGHGAPWTLVFLAPPPISTPPVFWPWVVLIVVGVGVTSLLAARSLARPLARLSTTAHDFGAGKLDARVRMVRSDELGQVAAAFDDMADRVTQALRLEKELLANVSHELRTPLQRIHIAVELASEGDASTARELLHEIAEDLSELERIVEDVLSTTRLALRDGITGASASPRMRSEIVDVRALVDKAVSRFRAARPRRPLRATIGDGLPAITADPVLLRRVLDNLLDNADKYTEDSQAEIAVVASRGPGIVRIEVRDRGVGISPPDLKRIFEPFFRAERSRARSRGGLGLGLALARRIIDAHGGTIGLHSALGAGTIARVELPVAVEGVAGAVVERTAEVSLFPGGSR